MFWVEYECLCVCVGEGVYVEGISACEVCQGIWKGWCPVVPLLDARPTVRYLT